MEKIDINGDLFFVDSHEKFAWILEEKLGADSAQYFRDALDAVKFDPKTCPGECDRTYRITEHYDREINDALEMLEAAKNRKLGCPWTTGKVDPDAFARAVKKLSNA